MTPLQGTDAIRLLRRMLTELIKIAKWVEEDLRRRAGRRRRKKR